MTSSPAPPPLTVPAPSDVEAAALSRDLDAIRSGAPVVHSITNFVVMEPTANALLALGASPIMAHALEEMDEMVAIASALVLNIGTLAPSWIEAMHQAGTAARALGRPVVLDPVGAGASVYRTQTVAALMESAVPRVVRGNASEILAVAGEVGGGRGVDSTAETGAAEAPARELARRSGAVVSVSGAVDLITSGDRGHDRRIHLSTPLMTRVTGMGCTASALTGAFLAVNPDALEAATHAMAVMAAAGRRAAARAGGPGTFLPAFHDALHHLDGAGVMEELEGRPAA